MANALAFMLSKDRFEAEFRQYGFSEEELDSILWGWCDLGFAVARLSESLWEKLAAVQQKPYREVMSQAERRQRAMCGKPKLTNHTAIVETGQISIQSEKEREVLLYVAKRRQELGIIVRGN